MLYIRKNIAAVLAVMLLAATSAYAADTPSEIHQRIGTGDPVLGKEKSAYCQGCHGEDGNSASPKFPKLAGQWADYIQKQVRNFQSVSRVNETMNEVALAVDEFNDLYDIASYFASQKQMGGTLIEPAANDPNRKLYLEGEKIYLEGDASRGVFRCIKCHGEHGRGEPLNNNLFPVLGGQYKEYIVKQLKEFKSGYRLNDHSGMMPRIASSMTEAEMEAVAYYLGPNRITPTPVSAMATPAAMDAPSPVAALAPASDAFKTLVENKTVRIEGTNFETGSAELKKSAEQQLHKVVEFAAAKPDAHLEVIGHTDNVGANEKNMKLSIARAESVKKFLVEHGVAADRITTDGMGYTKPVADNKTVEGRAQNRRVEIRSVTKEQKKVAATQ
jgi:outer membrane protein OmpA-like peptidoglycan-associated protein